MPCIAPPPAKAGTAAACAMTFDLGAARPLALVVIRDCGGRCALQASSDLTAWSDLGAVGSRFGAVQPAAVKARYLRVLMPAATQLGILSVW